MAAIKAPPFPGSWHSVTRAMTLIAYTIGLSTLLGISGCPDNDQDGYTVEEGDCDDNDPEVYPGAAERCNGLDDNCNDVVDEGLVRVSYPDRDGDGYGDAGAPPTESCEVSSGYVENNADCDDDDAAVFPGAAEVCNGVDDGCNGAVDEGVTQVSYPDRDGDGYGESGAAANQSCVVPQGYVANQADCNDANASVHPGAAERCDGVDNNCDGSKDNVVIFVDDDSDPELADGQSWSTAFPSIQEAVDLAAANVCLPEVWVAEGRYLPPAAGQPVLLMADGVIVRGGFRGDEERLEERAGEAAQTILSGDFGSDGGTNNSPNVVVAASGARLEAVTVADAYGVASSSSRAAIYVKAESGFELKDVIVRNNVLNGTNGSGAGLKCDGSSLLISDSIFTENSAYQGAALHSSACELTIVQTTFDSNVSQFRGAVYLYDDNPDRRVLIERTAFSNNTADQYAPLFAVLNKTSITLRDSIFQSNNSAAYIFQFSDYPVETLVEGCTFRDNLSYVSSGSTAQGALRVSGTGLTVTGSSFRSNGLYASGVPAGYGGALGAYVRQLKIQDSEFIDNVAREGGAINASASFQEADIISTVFQKNTAGGGSGGAIKASGSGTVWRMFNVLFDRNSTTADGGAFYGTQLNGFSCTHCSFDGNTSGKKGQSIYTTSGIVHTLSIVNSAFWAATSDPSKHEIEYGSGNTLSASYTCSPESYSGQGNIQLTSDPFDRLEAADGRPYLRHYRPCANRASEQAAHTTGAVYGLKESWWTDYSSSADMRDQGTPDMGFHHDPLLPVRTSCSELAPENCTCDGGVGGDQPWIVLKNPRRGDSSDSPTIDVEGIVYPSLSTGAAPNAPVINGRVATTSPCGHGALTFTLKDLPLEQGVNTLLATVTDQAGGTDQASITVPYSQHYFDHRKEVLVDAAVGLLNAGIWNNLTLWSKHYLTQLLPQVVTDPAHEGKPYHETCYDTCGDCGPLTDSYGIWLWLDLLSVDHGSATLNMKLGDESIDVSTIVSGVDLLSQGEFFHDADGLDSDDPNPYTMFVKADLSATAPQSSISVPPSHAVATDPLREDHLEWKCVDVEFGELNVASAFSQFVFDVAEDVAWDTDDVSFVSDKIREQLEIQVASLIDGYIDMDPDPTPVPAPTPVPDETCGGSDEEPAPTPLPGALCNDGTIDVSPGCRDGSADPDLCCLEQDGILSACNFNPGDGFSSLERYLSGELSSLLQATYSMETLGLPFEITTAVDDVTLTAGGVDLSLNLDLDYEQDPDSSSPGSFTYPAGGYVLNREPGMVLNLSFNLFNAFLHSVWESGALLRDYKPDRDLEFSTRPLLPPIMTVPEGNGLVEVTVGEILTTFLVPQVDGDPREVSAVLSLSATMDVKPLLCAGETCWPGSVPEGEGDEAGGYADLIAVDVSFSDMRYTWDVLDAQRLPDIADDVAQEVSDDLFSSAEELLEEQVRFEVDGTFPLAVTLLTISTDKENKYLSIAADADFKQPGESCERKVEATGYVFVADEDLDGYDTDTFSISAVEYIDPTARYGSFDLGSIFSQCVDDEVTFTGLVEVKALGDGSVETSLYTWLFESDNCFEELERQVIDEFTIPRDATVHREVRVNAQEDGSYALLQLDFKNSSCETAR